MAKAKQRKNDEEAKDVTEEQAAEIEEKRLEREAALAGAMLVDHQTRRSDRDGLTGQWVRVVGGDHAGQIATFVRPESLAKDGYPETILVRFRDASYDHQDAVVDYDDVTDAAYKGTV